MRSFLITALCFSLFYTTYARVAHSFHDLVDEDFEEGEVEPAPRPHKLAAVRNWIGHIFRRQNTTTCYEDEYYTFVEDDLGATWCQLFMHYPNVTATVEVTPTSTIIVTASPRVNTQVSVDRVTPTSTVTTTVIANSTAGGQQKRAVQPLAPQEKIDDAFRRFRKRQDAAASGSASGSSNANDAQISASFSSACNCQDYTGPTVTASYTNQPALATLTAFANEFTTFYTTLTDNPVYVTQTVTAGAAASSATSSPTGSASQVSASVITASVSGIVVSGTVVSVVSDTSISGAVVSGTEVSPSSSTTSETTSSNSALPTSPVFICPDDNNTTVSQMVGNERFDYLILCNTILGDDDLYTFNYPNLGECAAACSIADQKFNFPVCQGISYYDNVSGDNCHLKKSANITYNATGVDTAILERIAIAYPVGTNNTGNVTTETAPFPGSTPTQDPNQLSSSMSSFMVNSSTDISTITPGPPMPSGGLMANNPAITAYSTYVSDGTTFSTNSVYSFSTHYSNGTWWWTLITSWSVAWEARTTIIGETSGGTVVQNETTSSSNESTDTGTGNTIITTVTNTTSFNQTGYNLTEVISAVTIAANGSTIGSTASTTIFEYITATGISGTGGSGGSGGPATASAGVVTSIYSTEVVYSSGASGATGTGGSGGSGVVQVTSTYPGSVFSTVIVQSSGIAGSGAVGGSGGGTGGVVGTGGSGAPSPGIPGTASVIMNSSGTGGIMATGGSGAASSSSTPFSNSGQNRSPYPFPSSSSSSSPMGSFSAPNGYRSGGLPPSSSSSIGTGTAPVSAVNTTTSSLPGSVPSTGSILPSPSSIAGTFTAPENNRTGGYSTESSSSPATTTDTFTAPENNRTGGYSTGSNASPSTTGTFTAPENNRTGRYSTESNSSPSTTTGTFIAPENNRTGGYSTSSPGPASISPATSSTPPQCTCTPSQMYGYFGAGTPCPCPITPSSSPYPTTATTCPTATTVTVTVNQTFTQWTCASTCGWGHSQGWNGGPSSAGPPVIQTGSMSMVTSASAM